MKRWSLFLPLSRKSRLLLPLALCCGLCSAAAQAESGAEKFHRAYYLEHEKGDFAAAAKLYGEAAEDRELRAEAQRRKAACQEELAVEDFTRLAPAHTLAYVEVSRPAEQAERLLKQLGLLSDGSLAASAERRIAVSPDLVRGLAGLRGVAVAVTGFDPSAGKPTGVLIAHPGSLQVVRGLIHTALPAAAEAVEPIEGFPTYSIEGEVFVTLTHRLVIASMQRAEITGVIERLKGDGDESLAENEALAEELKARDGAALFACVNFQQVMPLVDMALAAGAGDSEELAMAQQLLDLKSLRMLTVRAGVADDGLAADVRLVLAEGHRNLAFHFLRMPVIDSEVLASIPRGAAGFAAWALSDASQSYASGAASPDEPVTILDVGREIFANLTGLAVFTLPGAEFQVDNDTVPGAALVMTVKDAAKSSALWTQMLGVASLASGGGSLAGATREIGGVKVRVFAMADDVRLYFAQSGGRIVLSPSEKAIAAALATGGGSILEDPAFAGTLAAKGDDATLAACVHFGRLMDTIEPMLDAGDLEEMAEMRPLLDSMSGALVVSHGKNALGLRLRLTGLPDVGPALTKLIEAELRNEGRRGRGDRLTQAAREGGPEAVRATAEELLDRHADDAAALNEAAWRLVTEVERGSEGAAVALRMAKRANELTGGKNWMYMDTLARAYFVTGDLERALRAQRAAVELAGSDPRASEAVAALREYEAADRAAAAPTEAEAEEAVAAGAR